MWKIYKRELKIVEEIEDKKEKKKEGKEVLVKYKCYRKTRRKVFSCFSSSLICKRECNAVGLSFVWNNSDGDGIIEK